MKLRSKVTRTLTVAAVCATLAVTSTGIANAASFTWQGYTRDSTWNCGPAGSTKDVGGLYVLPCTKTIGASWQVILIVTGGGASRILSDDELQMWNGNYDGLDCSGNVEAGQEFAPGQSLACFSPTLTNANTAVQGRFELTVYDDAANFIASADIVSPKVTTGS